jgi:hypothetical protein
MVMGCGSGGRGDDGAVRAIAVQTVIDRVHIQAVQIREVRPRVSAASAGELVPTCTGAADSKKTPDSAADDHEGLVTPLSKPEFGREASC